MATHFSEKVRFSYVLMLMFFLFAIGIATHAQEHKAQKISGYVYFNNKPFAGVNIKVLKASRGSVSDEKGFYEIEAQKG